MTDLLAAPTPEQLRIALPERRDIWLRVTAGVQVPRPPVLRPKDPDRRRRAGLDLEFFCEQYFPDQYNHPIDYHHDTLKRLQEELLTREPVTFKSADAVARGVGKTTMRRLAALWAALYSHEELSVFGGYKDDNAEPSLKAIKHWLFTNEMLFEDFPEICGWVRHINNDPKRAAPIDWSDNQARLPNGNWIMARGIFSGLVGINLEGKRPGFIVLDDFETVESIDSDSITEDIGNLIDQQIVKLPGSRKRGVIDLLGTVRKKSCNMARYTDPQRSPGWNITHLKGLQHEPEARALWERFLRLTRREEDPDAAVQAVSDEQAAGAMNRKPETFRLLKNAGLKSALRFYALHKAEMDAGAVLLDPMHLPLWECYRTIAEESQKTFQTEIQQEPWTEEEALDKRDWNVSFIQSHAANYPPLTLPPGCPAEFVTMGADVHKLAIYYIFRAWARDGTSWLIEAGISEIYLPSQADQVELDKARRQALSRLFEASQQGWMVGDRKLALALGFVDEGWETNQVRRFCHETRWLWLPVKGQPGMAHARFKPNQEHEPTVNLGIYHFKHDLARLLERTRGKEGTEAGYFHLNNLGAGSPGSHYQSYCKHMCSEVWQPKQNKDGTDVGEYVWETVNKNNHWWDCEVYALAAAVHCGISLLGEKAVSVSRQQKPAAAKQGWIRDRSDGGDWIAER